MGKIREKKDYLFRVKTKEDTDGLLEGSGIYVTKETEKFYYGLWSSMDGTFFVKVLKDKCVKLDDLGNEI